MRAPTVSSATAQPQRDRDRVPLVRDSRNPVSGDGPAAAAEGVFCVSLGVLRGPAAVHPRHDALHGSHRRVRGDAVRDARTLVDWLSHVQPSQLWTEQRGSLLLLAGILAASPLLVALQALLKYQAIFRELPDAAALEFPPADARAEHELLPGRVRRPRRDQGDADGARRARHLAHRRRHPGVHRHLLRDDARRRRQLRPVDARCRSSAGWRCTACALWLLRAAARQGRRGAGRRALVDDRARDGRLHQHRDRQAVLACEPRGRLRARRDAANSCRRRRRRCGS